MAQAPFTWGGGGRRLTPEQIAFERRIAAGMMQGDYSPVQSPWQGLARVAENWTGALRDRGAMRAADANAAEQQDLLAQILAGVGDDSPVQTPPYAPPAATGDIPAPPEARLSPDGFAARIAPHLQEAPADMPAPSVDPMQQYRDAIASIESRGSGDYAAIGPTHRKLGRALGRYQVMEANIGPWSREALGREVTPDEFLASPEIQDAIFNHRFGQYVERYGPQGAAEAWFAGPGGVGTNRQDALGTSVQGYAARFANALGPTAPTTAEQDIATALMDGGPMEQGSAYDDPAPMSMQQAPAPQPVGQMQTAARPPINPALIQALSSPYVDDNTKRIAMALFQQQTARAEPIEVNGRLIDPRTMQVLGDFSDPNTATVGRDVINVRTGERIYRGEQDLPTSVQEYQFGQRAPGYTEWDLTRRRSAAPQTNIAIDNQRDQSDFFSGLSKAEGESFQQILSNAPVAARALSQIDQLEGLLANVNTGAPAAWKQFAGNYGINTEGLSDIQAAQALINQLVPAQRPPGSGPMSDADLELFKQSLPRIINQPGGNQIIIDTMRDIQRYDMQLGSIVQEGLARAEATTNPQERAAIRSAMRQRIAGLGNPVDRIRQSQQRRGGGRTGTERAIADMTDAELEALANGNR